MKMITKRWLSLLLAALLLMSTVAVSFAASGVSVGQVKKVELVSAEQTQIKLKWSKVKNATGYCVLSYDAKKEQWNAKAYTTSAAFTDKGLDAGTKYTYKVRAYVKNGSSRVYGKDSAKISALTKPARVEKVTVKAVNPAKVKLSWGAAKGATGYIVYEKNSKDKYVKVASTKKRSYTINYDAAPGLTYYKVRAYAKNGSLKKYASYSPAAKVKTKPAKVESLTATNIQGASATLKWKASAGASEYIVYKKDLSTSGEFVQAAVVKTNSYNIKYPAAPGQTYYRVRARATYDGKTTVSSVSSSIGIYFKPKGVTTLNLKSAGATTLTLEWSGADGVSEYRVYRYIKGELTEVGRTKKTTFVDKGLEPETRYVYHVRAFAQFEQQELATPMSPYLDTYTSFGVIKGFDFVVNSNNTAILSWDLLPGAEGYEVEKKFSTGWSKIGDTDETVFNVSDQESGGKLGFGKTYEYRVHAYMTEEGEKIYSPYTDVAEVHSIPAKVKSLQLAAGADHSIVLDWPAVEGADAYHIQFYNEVEGNWVDYFTLPGKSYDAAGGDKRVGYQDTGIEQSGIYQYRVAAAVVNAGRWSFGEFSEPKSFKYEYEAEPENDFVPGLQRSGIFGYLYDPRENVFYTAEDPWQRNFGFNEVYDLASQFVWIQYDTIRFKFTYQGEEWMIQPWKGQYGAVLYGSEIGIYKKYTEREADHYDCVQDEDRLQMSMDLDRFYPNEEGTGGEWRHEFSRPYATYWWCTGFKLGWIRFTSPGQAIAEETYPDLRANFRVTMKDFEMLQAFTASLREQGYKETNLSKPGKLQYSVKGLDVYFPF